MGKAKDAAKHVLQCAGQPHTPKAQIVNSAKVEQPCLWQQQHGLLYVFLFPIKLSVCICYLVPKV